MASGTSVPWVTLIAAVGVGSIVAAVFARWSAISVLRQNWINALREDLVAYLREIDAMHYRIGRVLGRSGDPGTIQDLEKQQETRNAVLLVYRRILLRLNLTEQPHIRLAESLHDLLLIKDTTADSNQIDAVITLTREVLKNEWEVTKYGVFTPLFVALKTRRNKKGKQT